MKSGRWVILCLSFFCVQLFLDHTYSPSNRASSALSFLPKMVYGNLRSVALLQIRTLSILSAAGTFVLEFELGISPHIENQPALSRHRRSVGSPSHNLTRGPTLVTS